MLLSCCQCTAADAEGNLFEWSPLGSNLDNFMCHCMLMSISGLPF